MDPVSAVGLATGVISLAFDTFDNTIKLFKFLGALVDMPKNCQKYRLQLIMEYNRVLAWGEAAGLVDIPDGSSLGATLGTNALELVSILARIQWLLGEFREINARYGNELAPNGNEEVSEETSQGVSKGVSDVDVVSQVSSLAVSYEKKRERRRFVRGTNHIRGFLEKAAHNVKEVVTHPARVRWVAIDEEAFKALLSDLHVLTERLHELMRDHRDKKIDAITAKTYREMLLVRNDIQDLKVMVDAAGSLAAQTRTSGSRDTSLRDLAEIKRISRTSEVLLSKLDTEADFDVEQSLADLGITVRQYSAEDLPEQMIWHEEAEFLEELPRPRATLTTPEGDVQVWVEWKTVEGIKPGSPLDKVSKLRTVALAEMLHVPKPRPMYLPTCIGYFDDWDVSDVDQGQRGWIFQMPPRCDDNTTLKSLFELLGQPKYRPTLAQRISLAAKLASSVLYLHTVNWLHKGIYSENVAFYVDDDHFDPTEPVLSGFEYSRPEVGSKGAPVATTRRSLDPRWDIYRWPAIQRQVPRDRNSRRTYDIYSLGLVLLEIAHWKPLHKLLGLSKWPEVPVNESSKIRGWLLDEEAAPPFGETHPVAELRHLVGERYWSAVTRCLRAHGELGLGIDELADQTQTFDGQAGIELQEKFSEYVVDNLLSVKI